MKTSKVCRLNWRRFKKLARQWPHATGVDRSPHYKPWVVQVQPRLAVFRHPRQNYGGNVLSF